MTAACLRNRAPLEFHFSSAGPTQQAGDRQRCRGFAKSQRQPPMTSHEFDSLKEDVSQLSLLLADIRDAAAFASPGSQAVGIIACADRIHQTLTDPEDFRDRLRGRRADS